MWREAVILVVVAVTMVECDFDPRDQNDFIDDPGDYEAPVTSDPLRVSDIASLRSETKGVEGVVEKLLGQAVFHYEDPATTPPVSSPPSTSPQSQSEAQPREPQVKGSDERASQLLGFQRESQERGEHLKLHQLPSEVKQNIPERRQTDQTKSISEWSHEAPTHPPTPAFLLELTSPKFRRRPKLKTRSPRHSINEVVYSIHVPWEAEHPRVGRVAGVVESLVEGHDIVHHEIPNLGCTRSRPDARAGHILTTKDDSARRQYLVTLPAFLKTVVTRPPRPTPTTQTLMTVYKYTRITRKHPNCTDTYYECLLKCFDKRGYRIKCPWDTPPPRPEPMRLNFTGLFLAINSPLANWDTDQLLKTHLTMDCLSCDVYDSELVRLCEEIESDQEMYEIGELLSQLHSQGSNQVGRGRKRTATSTGAEVPVKRNYPSNSRDMSTSSSEEPLSDVNDFRRIILEKGYRDCKSTTRSTTTFTVGYPVYYDDLLSNKTGTIMAKCWVCGLLDTGVPTNSYCADNFGKLGNSLALIEKSTYRKYCRYMDEVALWFNRSDPFAVYGPWTGGCSTRWLDVSGLYTQRTCRSIVRPATGMHFMSKRMALLELALTDVKSGCVVSPVATLVPFSRAISLFARVHVCVCAGSFCNNAPKKIDTERIGAVILMVLLFLRL